MDDGRVLCYEDASQYGRSYPNDCLYVYTPEDNPGNHSNANDGRWGEGSTNETADE